MWYFFSDWLLFEEVDDFIKDLEVFFEFNECFVVDLCCFLELFIEDIVWSVFLDYCELLMLEIFFVNECLVFFYELDVNLEFVGFEVVKILENICFGILIYLLIMVVFLYYCFSFLIYWGVFLI